MGVYQREGGRLWGWYNEGEEGEKDNYRYIRGREGVLEFVFVIRLTIVFDITRRLLEYNIGVSLKSKMLLSC
jgi:hypothetical protein